MKNLNALPEPWQICLQLALEGYNAGSLGIAAVIVDKTGKVIARGRNQLYDDAESCSAIRMTPVAHAEINAINNLPPEYQDDWGLTLYTTVEPCPMCLGAVAMSKIRSIQVGCADAHAGATILLTQNAYLQQKNIAVNFAGGEVEKLCFVLHYLSLRRCLAHQPGHRLFASLKARYPQYVQIIDAALDLAGDVHGQRMSAEFLEYFSARLG